jgi:hypothetical protein
MACQPAAWTKLRRDKMRKKSVLEEVRDVLKEIRDRLSQSVMPFTPIRSKDGRFVRNADGTVTDNQEKLVWYPTLEKKFTWEEAKKECAKLGCRLPTTHELFSLVDVNRYSPAIDKEIFPETKTDDYYWTGDTCPWDADNARVVSFDYGGVSYCSKGYDFYVRPVRSSQ